MSAILTAEEKKYIRRVCRYLGSLGMSEGNIEFDLDDSYLNCSDINWRHITHFANNYNAEIPEQMVEIMKKIFDHICDQELLESPDVDNINYQRIELTIHCGEGEVTVSNYYSYYTTSDGEGISFTLEDFPNDDEMINVFETLKEEKISSKKGEPLRLDYNGSGDSGYLEDDFTNGTDVPEIVKDVCYRMLENNFGGWEINEGSQGHFLIDTSKKSIELIHYQNNEETQTDTVWEETF